MTVKFQLSDPGPIELTTFPSYKHSGSLNKSYFKHSAAMVVIIFHKSYIVPVKYEKIYSERHDHEAMVTDEKKIILITMTFHLPLQKVMKSNLSYFIKYLIFWCTRTEKSGINILYFPVILQKCIFSKTDHKEFTRKLCQNLLAHCNGLLDNEIWLHPWNLETIEQYIPVM